MSQHAVDLTAAGPLRRGVQQYVLLLRHRVRGMLGLPTDRVTHA
ncbi:hypothetical protein [Salinispora mooreana]|nr:hypothetical protein [Salinispora mooreana]